MLLSPDPVVDAVIVVEAVVVVVVVVDVVVVAVVVVVEVVVGGTLSVLCPRHLSCSRVWEPGRGFCGLCPCCPCVDTEPVTSPTCGQCGQQQSRFININIMAIYKMQRWRNCPHLCPAGLLA